MALIGTIRKNSWILIVLIGFALGGFIIMDMTSAGGNTGGGGQFSMGKVYGQEIDYREFQNTQNVLYSGGGASVFDQRNYLWNYFVEKAIVEKEADQLGLSVGSNELNELQFGSNISPIIQQRFMNPNTGQIDYNQLNSFRQAIQNNTLAPEFRQMWYYQEKEVIKAQLQSKLNNIVSKGIYTPTWMAEMAHHNRNDKISFEYVQIPFDEVADSEIEVSDADLKAYIQENKAIYNREEETRKIDYAAFNVIPTSKDSADLWSSLESTKQPFQNAENDSLIVETNFGTIDVVYFTPDELAPEIREQIQTMEPGDVYGPYQAGDEYRLVKLLDKKVIADSVKARHILRQAQTQQELISGIQFLDSLKELIESGVEDFDSLAIRYSQDGGSASLGGDLGFNHRSASFVKPFKDMIFYQGEIGELNTVVSQFGIHLIEVTDRKFLTQEDNYQVAYLQSPIIPSEETQDVEYDRVTDIVTNNQDLNALTETIQDIPGIEIQQSGFVQKNDAFLLEIGTNQTARDIIRWAFDGDTEIGDVSPEVYINEDAQRYFNNKYLIVALSEIEPAGMASLESVRDDITPIVVNKKKAAVLTSKVSGSDLSAIAEQFGSAVDSVTDITFSATFVPGLGNESKVIAQAFKLKINEVSAPIAGENGVYVIRITDRIDDVTDPNIALMRNQTSSQFKSSVPTQLMQSIKKNVKIRDNRFTFF